MRRRKRRNRQRERNNDIQIKEDAALMQKKQDNLDKKNEGNTWRFFGLVWFA